jgi:serine/threonine protein kinase
MKTVKH